jgi:hypothetical protein
MPTMRIVALTLLAFFAGATTAVAQRPDIPAGCREGDNAIKICTDFLQRKNITPEQRAYALVRRGDAYRTERSVCITAAWCIA